MKTNWHLFLFGLITILFNTVSFAQSTPQVPLFVTEVLKRHSCWQTSSFMNLGQSKVILVAKKWALQNDNHSVDLVEKTQVSLSSEGKWVSAQMHLPDVPYISDLTNFPFKGSFNFTQMAGDRLLATVNVGFNLEVLFFPSICSDSSPQKYYGDIGVGETPFGLTPPPMPYVSLSQPKYIHHKSGSTIVVRLDKGFPLQFVGTVLTALKKWNSAIGWDVYTLSPQQDSLDALECLSTNSLCLLWEGRQDNIGWIGWGGLTGLNFDPQTGEILGSVISLQNLSLGDLVPTPPNILNEISNDFSMDLVAKLLLRKDEFKKYSHPFPEQILEHVILHEIGHANGLRHDFRGSLTGTPSHPSESVMEYMPFVVSHKLNYIGSRDLGRIKAVYKNMPPQIPLKTCSDAEAKEGLDPNCLQNDLGEPTLWYLRLSDLGDKGPFTTVIENQSGLPERPYLDLLGKFIENPSATSRQEQTVSEYLCRSNSKVDVQRYLKDTQKKSLTCP